MTRRPETNARIDRQRQQRLALAAALRWEGLQQYGGCCSGCGDDDAAAVEIVARAADGSRSYSPGVMPVVFWQRLKQAGWPKTGKLGGKLHRIELRCGGCRRGRQHRSKPVNT